MQRGFQVLRGPDMSLSVVIPAFEAMSTLPATLTALAGVDEVVVVDGDSTDGTRAFATNHGARVVEAKRGRGPQLIAGAAAARCAWLLFLHADTVPEAGWRAAVERFIADPVNLARAATFRFAVDDASRAARRLEALVALRVRIFGLAYGDQGLLMHRDFYAALGGFRPWPLMEDVDLVRRVGRSRLTVLPATTRTSAARWRREGWTRRSLRNVACLTLFALGASPRALARWYEPRGASTLMR
ncbi:MAG: TIGR04283 family arsenosugar biosynthesis glycosyltransferase [Gemmatimonadaceae bacterium]|nr:TIGR04283 family arsenosugar biosynthesis glycosyltransferase [Gemmatimonadaceae bacterium]